MECRVDRVGNSEVVLAEVCRIVASSDTPARTFRSASIDRDLAAWSGAHRQTVVRRLVRAGVELRRVGLTRK